MSKLTAIEISHMQNIFNDSHTDYITKLHQAKQYLGTLKGSKGQSKIVWLTINPKPQISFSDFKKTVDKFLTRTFVRNVKYVYEQRGETEETMGKGFHVHILYDKDKCVSPSQMTTYIQNSFKHCVGNLKSIDIKFYLTAIREEKEQYLLGNKWNEDKSPKLAIDIKWRQSLQL